MLRRPDGRPRGFRAWARVCVLMAVTGGLCAVQGAATGVRAAEARLSAERTVSVAFAGARGSVVSVPRGIACTDDCDAAFSVGTEVTLTAGSSRASVFAGWGGDCVGQSSLCVVLVDRTVDVTARFRPASNTEIGFVPVMRSWLYVTAPRTGGKLRNSRGIRCPGKCKARFANGTPVTLRAHADRGYAANPIWQTKPSGLCQGDRCVVRLLSDVEIAATFRRLR